MRAFHGDPELKRLLLMELGKHEAADAIVKGRYGEMDLPVEQIQGFESFKGCAIGCALHSLNALNGAYCPTPKAVSDHARFPAELGIPIELAFHIDALFENLPTEESQTWPRQVIEACSPGADLSGVMPALLQWMILDPAAGLISKAQPQFHETYRQFAALVAKDWEHPGSVSDADWRAIDSALIKCEEWAWARAWAGARAWAWARAYSQLSEQTLTLIRNAPIIAPIE